MLKTDHGIKGEVIGDEMLPSGHEVRVIRIPHKLKDINIFILNLFLKETVFFDSSYAIDLFEIILFGYGS